jgi:preprotein translocase subunit YajC
MTLFILLQAGTSNPIMQLLPLALIFVVFYFFLIRPQAKRQKDQTKFMSAIEKGQDVVTQSGILGKIVNIEDDTVTIDVGNKTVLKVVKSSLSKDMTEAIYGKK